MIDICIPVGRPQYIETVLDSFERADRTHLGCVSLASNELHDLKPRPFEVRIVRFSSSTRYYGMRSIPVGYNMAVYGADAEHCLIFDDDQLAPKSLLNDCQALIDAGKRFAWGNYHYYPEGLTPEEVTDLPDSAGRLREHPNFDHLYYSGYTGLLLIERALYWEMGALDLSIEHSTDQQFARRLAERFGDGKRTHVYDPPFAWHPEERIPYEPNPKTNSCGNHDYEPKDLNGYAVMQCKNCPWHTIHDNDQFVRLVNQAREPGLRFDPSEWDIQVESFPAT